MNELFIGLLSGTSMDAIDVALVDFTNAQPQLLHTLNYPIPPDLKKACLALTHSDPKHSSIDECCQLDAKMGALFSSAILHLLKENNLSPEKITAIGSHGQTVRHFPNANPPFTLQIGDPNIIAQQTGITTVADFRRRDIAAGGQGAPLAPAFHNAIFHSSKENRAVVNIGGLSNITLLPSNKQISIGGFDTGPGNCLLDQWVQKNCDTPFDQNGAFARSGRIHSVLLKQCLSDPYFSQKPPKSTGREYFNLNWLEKKLNTLKKISPEDVQATLLALTATSIAQEIQQHAPKTSKVFICGGGARNDYLMETLAQKLTNSVVMNTEELGVHSDWVEGVLFAWLAKQTLNQKPGNCPQVTGAIKPVILGGIFLGN